MANPVLKPLVSTKSVLPSGLIADVIALSASALPSARKSGFANR